MHGTMTGTTKQIAGSRGTTSRALVCALVSAAALLSPAKGWTMAADGALITNIVSATYHGAGGYPGAANPFAPKYTMSYNATATILVSCPVVAITKRASTTVQAVAGTVTFEICAVNSSLNASAWNLVITDKLMDNMSYAPLRTSWAPAGTTITPVSSTDNAVWVGAEPANGTFNPLWLRWTISPLGPGRSACVQFKAVVL